MFDVVCCVLGLLIVEGIINVVVLLGIDYFMLCKLLLMIFFYEFSMFLIFLKIFFKFLVKESVKGF